MARILIIEDNPANLKLASLLLRNADHTVLCAVDAETGLAVARTELPDLILMDIQLPDMDGLAATKALKQDAVTAAIPVIALTAMAMKADEERSQVAGCDAYLAKPLHYKELYGAIDSLLAKGKQPLEADASRRASRPIRNRAAAVQPPPRDEAVRSGRLVLVAEDNQTNQELITLQLALLGFAADVAGSGSAALEQWQSGEHALVLTDLHMPGMDGYALARAIRAQERQPNHVPIVALSASASKLEADGSAAAGMDDYLCKPMQLAQLKAALDRWLPAVGSQPQASSEEPAAACCQPCAVDVRVLERLIGNDPGVVGEFLRDFRAGTQATALQLRAACTGGDVVQAGEQAHKLMSSARSVGAMQLGQLCDRMAAAGRSRDTGLLAALWPAFEQELDAVMSCLDRLNA